MLKIALAFLIAVDYSFFRRREIVFYKAGCFGDYDFTALDGLPVDLCFFDS